MKDMLVLTNSEDEYRLISNTLSDAGSIRRAFDLNTALTLHTQSPFDLIMADIELLAAHPGMQAFSSVNPFVQFIVLCIRSNTRKALEAVKAGAVGYLLSPFCERDIHLLIPSLNRTRSKDFELEYLRDRFWKIEWMDIIRSKNTSMKKIFENVRSVAPTIATVLLLGETGTGKGTLARLIHWHSQRSEKPFISIHCGAIPDTLIESELFGHEKGAFTGAERKRPGRFEMADGGTIFLDEVGTISPSAQIKLLQVLQDGTFSRIGGDSLLKANVRIIAATNLDLEDAVRKGTYRKDLFYRLNVFPIEIPPLKERLEDMEYLVDIFLKKLNVKYGKNIQTVHPSVIEGFGHYEWPGNIRELENILERAYILETSPVIASGNLPIETQMAVAQGIPAPGTDLTLAQARQHAVNACEFSYLTCLLAQTHGRINDTAQKAGITARQLNRLLTRHGLDKKQFKPKKDA
ncbi:sigma-54-dependent Fis family transcriptional regulator [Desulfobacter hydrogenophilus]|uniref:Sigma-54-dependent Fis family transcriptional regulator n=1 Tax=Desulfobacter hydrogenophilus TaxID=2291 RepID=A0A328FHP6_9BACT|nr:sigma-54 dependent transcriptional regulator [Desulfobacter hydrogenophilus]NDY72786.1 sigma-54-dependent Fis family transcriptional regulator [Desulfobacter hydrogenophilus]QBH13015.1 sigma-54-dependent Fis family transcriptional regulator [Desulfobacter hydrogenophilus]RAM03999.1 sigma-54-dependent Fis family transcriptional regulator [Desulfobacter hydrogenophilus]